MASENNPKQKPPKKIKNPTKHAKRKNPTKHTFDFQTLYSEKKSVSIIQIRSLQGSETSLCLVILLHLPLFKTFFVCLFVCLLLFCRPFFFFLVTFFLPNTPFVFSVFCAAPQDTLLNGVSVFCALSCVARGTSSANSLLPVHTHNHTAPFFLCRPILCRPRHPLNGVSVFCAVPHVGLLESSAFCFSPSTHTQNTLLHFFYTLALHSEKTKEKRSHFLPFNPTKHQQTKTPRLAPRFSCPPSLEIFVFVPRRPTKSFGQLFFSFFV